MSCYTLKISSPVQTLTIDEVDKTIVRSIAGDIGILAGHIPYASAVKAGKVRCTLSGGEQRDIEISDGIIKVKDNLVTILTQTISE